MKEKSFYLLFTLAYVGLCFISCEPRVNAPEEIIKPDSVLVYEIDSETGSEIFYEKKEYQYDSNGNMISELTIVRYGLNGTIRMPNHKIGYTYDANNNMLSSAEYLFDQSLNDWSEISQFTLYSYNHNKQSKIVVFNGIIEETRDTIAIADVTWVDDQQSWIIQKSRIDNALIETFKINHFFTQSNKLEKSVTYDLLYADLKELDKPIYIHEYSYDSYDNLIESSLVSSGKLTYKEIFEHTYNENGVLIQSICTILDESEGQNGKKKKYIYYYPVQ